mmetsp:Transcript_13737/g.20842  ORF Transcript_13737/g.20842 Transcript_13737/m.20842 type:complete len:780 (-) Transcript_13737:1057-3396(-)|eukprot:CAMPEP_0203668140 /NCGR_PEP_ID=MMETSP0090-20130426/4837_1 /ASSEMBLY_ACC=CAM_ASM_001088 /TAXON_ID=426623 /ORGANISM="Chaetoceros affinis, Strain CCMP159" /LENGTH=779 /DNA_ID=CAMNT_0050532497 /DNA_START=138 /DNA_END=2477 /DNA_ORIENTATION=+
MTSNDDTAHAQQVEAPAPAAAAAVPAPAPATSTNSPTSTIETPNAKSNSNSNSSTGTKSNAGTDANTQTRQYKHEDENPLKLKPQFVLSSTHPSLTPLEEQQRQTRTTNVPTSTSTEGEGEGGEGGDSREKHPNQKQKQNRHRKNKRELKKRSRESNNGNGGNNNICKAFMMGGEEKCPFGDKCKYSHDLKEMLNTRVDDIKVIDSCPHFDLKGQCPYGLNCRIGSKHLNFATGQNICKSKEEMELLAKTYDTKVMNIISRKVSDQLRRRKYKFACKRHNEKKDKKKDKGDDNGKGPNGNENLNDNGSEKKLEEDFVMKDKEVVKDEQEGKENQSKVDETMKKEGEMNGTNGDTKNEDCKEDVEMTEGGNKETKENSVDVVADTKSAENGTTVAANTNTTTDKPPVDMSPLPKTRKLIDFSNKVYVAPLTTVGNLPFRRVMKKFSADITCGEMAVAHNLLQGKSGEWALLKRHPDEDVFGVQIAAGHADVYTRISEVIENEGLDIDFLDMNLGCPIDVLCNQGCGARLMTRDNKLRESLKGMTNVLSIPVTVKIRTGWDEKKPFAHKLVPKIQEWGGGGVAAVMVHGRSRLQRYSKLANWDYIQQVYEAQSNDIPKLPIIGNGDIFSYTDYEEKVLKHEGLSQTAMIGRGALIKPWLPTEIKERRHWDISASERLDFLKDFVKFGLEHWGSDQQGVNTTRRFLLEWLSFLYRYIPVGMLEVLPQSMNQRPPAFMCGRNDLETLMLSKNSKDWVKISEMLLGPVPEGFEFEPKHKANSYK